MFKNLDKKVKRLKAIDLSLIKLTAVSATLFLITVWPAAMELVQGIHWGWFLGAMIVFGLRPFKKLYM